MIEVHQVKEFTPYGRSLCKSHPSSAKGVGNKDDILPELLTDNARARWGSIAELCTNKKEVELWELHGTGALDCDEELYVYGCTVVWSKGSNSDSRVVCKSYTVNSYLQQALWCNFRDVEQDSGTVHSKPDCVKRSLCAVECDSINVWSDDGKMYTAALPFFISHAWAVQDGLLMDRVVSQSEINGEKKDIPIVFSMQHPLDEPKPVVFKIMGDATYMSDPKQHIVYTNQDLSLVMMYESDICAHSLWVIKQAKPEDIPVSVTIPSNPPTPEMCRYPTPLLSSHFSRLMGNSPAFSPHHTPSPSSSRLHKHHMEHESPGRVLSPIPGHVAEGHVHSPSFESSLVGSGRNTWMSRSPPNTAPISKDVSILESHELLVPDVCLEHVWQEEGQLRNTRNEEKGQATKVFTTQNLIGKKFLCYLIGQLKWLRGIQYDFDNDNDIVFGSTFNIPCGDATPVPALNMMLVLEMNGSLALFSGPSKICMVTVPSLMTMAITPRPVVTPSLMTPNTSTTEESVFFSPFPDDSSGVKMEVEELMSSGDLVNCIQSLRDSVDNRCTVVLRNGKMLQVSFLDNTSNPLVIPCVSALKAVLPESLCLEVLKKCYVYYNNGVRSRSESEPRLSEWDYFAYSLFSLMGFNATDVVLGQASSPEVSSPIPAKKTKTQHSEGDEEDWEWLLKSDYHMSMKRHICSQLQTSTSESISASTQEQSLQLSGLSSSSAVLFPYIPTVLFIFHLVYEDLKLNSLTAGSVQPLGKFLCQLAYYLGWSSYVGYYTLDHPILRTTASSSLASPTENQLAHLHVPSYVTENPPSVFKWLCQYMKEAKHEPFPILNNVCKQTYRIVKLYSLLIPDYDGCYSFDESRIFKQIISEDNVMNEDGDADTSMTPSAKAVKFMVDQGMTLKDLECLPVGICLPLKEAIYNCSIDAPLNLPKMAYSLIGRHDMAMNTDTNMEKIMRLNTPVNKSVIEGETDDGMNFDDEVTTLRFSKDLRIHEVRNLLQSSRPVRVALVQKPEVSDHEFMQEQEQRLLLLCKRTMSLPIGRGMFSLASSHPVITEALSIPSLELTGRAPPRDIVVNLEHIDVPGDMAVWPHFHNGVAAGLRIAPGLSKIDSTWIVYNRPTELTNEHAGFLMALGLLGHLSNLATMNIHDYLRQSHELTSVGLLLGIAAAKRGTMDLATTKLMSIHVDALLPPTSTELDIPHSVQVAAILGIGLLYQGTMHRRMAEVLLSEIGRPPGPEMENSCNRESYSLAAGLALGMVMLEHAYDAVGMSDIKIADHLFHYMVGGHKKPQTGTQKEKFKSPSYQIREGDSVNTDVTAPGAILALGLMFLKSNNKAVASWLNPPDTQFLLDFIRPDFLLLRLLSRGLIMWDFVQPTKDWVTSHIPEVVKKYAFCCDEESVMNEDSTIDLQALSQAMANIIAGCCLSMGFRFAGSANKQAFDTLMHYTKFFKDMLGKPECEQAGKHTVETCLDAVLVGLAMVMAGTGNLDVLRIARQLRKRLSPEVTYGSHMAVHMAVGLLFIGAGRYTLSTSGPAIAALICALYPRFPFTSTDNRYHLQAFRHLYVLAVEPRLIVTREADTDEACYVPLEITLKKSKFHEESTLKMTSPTILPELHLLKQIRICGPRYWPMTLELDVDPALPQSFLSKFGTVFVQRRAGHLPYAQDPKGFRNLLARTFTGQTGKVEVVKSFSSDHQIISFAEHFCDELGTSLKSEINVKFLSSILFECVAREKPELIQTYFALHQAAQTLGNNPRTEDVQQLQLAVIYYMYAHPRLKDQHSKSLLSDDFIASLKIQVDAQSKSFL